MTAILSLIDDAFQKCRSIDEIGTVVMEKPADGDESGAVMLVENKLGIAHWALKPLFAYALSTFFELYHSLKKKEIILD